LPTIAFAADGCVIGHWRNLSIAVWATQATVPLVSEFAKVAELLYATHALTSTVHLIINDAPVPGADARAMFDALTKRFLGKVLCSVTVIESSGFLASAMRSFLTGLLLVARPNYKSKVAANIHEAATWLAENHVSPGAGTAAASELEKVFEWMLAQPSVRGLRV
jgi:hypothetical protein